MLIEKDLIILNLEETNKEDVIKKLAALADAKGRVSDLEAYVKAVLKREEEYSTAVGFGVAIPHGKTDAISKPVLMYGRVKGIDWKALDNEPVYNVFMIGVPESDAGNVHLKILAKLSRKLMKEDFREALREASSEDQLIELLVNNNIM